MSVQLLWPLLVAVVVGWPTSPAQGSKEPSKSAPSLQQLGQDATSESASVRRKALRALADRGGPETLAALAPLVLDGETDIAAGAIEAVIGVYVQPPKKISMRHAADAFVLAPYHATPWPVPAGLSAALVKALADDDAIIRCNSAYAVAIVLPPPVSDATAFELVASLSDRDSSVRLAAARALGRLRVKSAGVPLVGRINDEDLEVRLASMRALGELREISAVAAITEQYWFYVRGSAGRAAIDALARIADPSSGPLLDKQAASGYPAHRQAAYEGLARMGSQGSVAPQIEAAMSSEKDKRVLAAMAFALAASGRPGSVNQVVDALADHDDADTATAYLIELGRRQAGAIAARLADPNPAVRAHVAIALGFIGGPEGAAALSAAAAEAEPDVRRAIDVAQLRAKQLATPAPKAP